MKLSIRKKLMIGFFTLVVMILIMGLLVGFVVISVLLPIFEMNQLVK